MTDTPPDDQTPAGPEPEPGPPEPAVQAAAESEPEPHTATAPEPAAAWEPEPEPQPAEEPEPEPEPEAAWEPEPAPHAAEEPEPEPQPAEEPEPEPASWAGAPGPAPQFAPPRRLYRSRDDQKLGGVAAGLAEFLGVDPTIVRLATLLLAFTGVGILVYLAAWLIVPVRPEGHVEPPPSAPLPHERSVTFALGIAAIATAIGIVSGSWFVLAVALIGGGVWLLSEQSDRRPVVAGAANAAVAAAAPPASYPPAQYRYATPAAPTSAPGPGTHPGVASPPPPNWSAVPPSPPAEPRRPQRVTWVVLSLLSLLAGIGIAAAAGDWWNVSATRFLGIGVVIIGIGVVVGQIRGGGARGLIPLGILAALTLFPVAAVDGLVDDGVGDSEYRPAAIEDLQTEYRHGVGELTVDLSAIDFEGHDARVEVDLGIGELTVIVPDDVGGRAELDADAGEVSYQVPGSNRVQSEDGINVDTGVIRLQGESGTLEIDIHVGLGAAELRLARS